MPRFLPIVFDLVCVIVFAVVGRASHVETLTPSEIARTAAPFVAGTLIAWIALITRPVTRSPLRQGLVVWLATLILGMIFRTLVGQGVQASFVIVAGLALAAGMLGWRAVAMLIGRRRTPSR